VTILGDIRNIIYIQCTITSLQPINVLCVHLQKDTFVTEQPHEVVDNVGPIKSIMIQVLGQRKEGLRVAAEVVEVKDSLCIWQVVLGQVVVESRSWCPINKSQPMHHFPVKKY